ncbi:MAG TPA: 3-methyl-2-oxobutanoate hydroxymethyltransferase [Gammaproteobacteria bacterium]|nr:3-methyl-2-oxobutanoate hydroxymethyltransferase [Gammaproteobacteria bacterium]|tara:strand:- start:331 stop:1146 length:816 start_codon:yes stop_codon:yes gene_type:complete
MSAQNDSKKVTLRDLNALKNSGTKIASLTAYDAGFAAMLDKSGMDFILVGDSLGMVVQGRETTIPVTIDEIIYHTQMVVRGTERAMVMADLPFMSYSCAKDCLNNAARLMKEGGAEIVKLEWGALEISMVSRLTECGIPVCAHLGLTPQAIYKYGAYRVQGREEKTAKQMIDDARALEEAGADMLLLECVPTNLAAKITKNAGVPVIGIGAGPKVDGQILVLYDILDIWPGKRTRFSKNYMAEGGTIQKAVESFVTDVKMCRFPTAEYSFE